VAFQASVSLDPRVLTLLPQALARVMRSISPDIAQKITEIRLRAGHPLFLAFGSSDAMLDKEGRLTEDGKEAVHCGVEDLMWVFQTASKSSVYAFEEEIRQGFITVEGGHRIGFAGQAVVLNDRVETIKNIGSVNIRLAREIKGCSENVLPFLIQGGRLLNTIIISPPGCGKTTLLRDLVRQASSGNSKQKLAGATVGLVDERSEIAACAGGIPTVDLGPRADVLDGCPKAVGMIMLIRAMGPRVLVTDELGRPEDAVAVRDAVNAGVCVITSAHAHSVEDLLGRPHIGDIIRQGLFDRAVVLSSEPVPGTVKEIVALRQGKVLFRRKPEGCLCG